MNQELCRGDGCRYLQNDPAADKNGDGVFQYIVLEGEADHQDAIVRTEYAVSTITDQGVPVEKLGYAIANWNRAQANTKMESASDGIRGSDRTGAV